MPKLKADKRELTISELDVLRQVAVGLTDSEIAANRGSGVETVKRQNYAIRNKIGCDNRVGMTLWALRKGLVEL